MGNYNLIAFYNASIAGHLARLSPTLGNSLSPSRAVATPPCHLTHGVRVTFGASPDRYTTAGSGDAAANSPQAGTTQVFRAYTTGGAGTRRTRRGGSATSAAVSGARRCSPRCAAARARRAPVAAAGVSPTVVMSPPGCPFDPTRPLGGHWGRVASCGSGGGGGGHPEAADGGQGSRAGAD